MFAERSAPYSCHIHRKSTRKNSRLEYRDSECQKKKEWKQAWLADKWRVLYSYTHDYVYSFRNHKKEEVKFEQKSVSRRTDVTRTLWIDKAWRVSTANTLRLEYIYFLWPTNIMLKALKWKQ